MSNRLAWYGLVCRKNVICHEKRLDIMIMDENFTFMPNLFNALNITEQVRTEEHITINLFGKNIANIRNFYVKMFFLILPDSDQHKEKQVNFFS